MLSKPSLIALGGVAVGMAVYEPLRTFAVAHWFVSLLLVGALVTLLQYNEWRGGVASILNHDDAKKMVDVNGDVNSYEKLYGNDSRTGGTQHAGLLGQRLTQYTEMVNKFYNLVTDFYEYGWGESFHFAPMFKGETFHESIRRHEYFLASRLGLRAGKVCADFGCGVGGPMRNIARFSGATIVGINNNDYQIKVGSKYIARDNLVDYCSFKKSDFMHLEYKDNHFDCAYAIEATCHAPDKVACFAEVMRVVKPGGLFGCYEWVMTSKYDPKNARQRAIKEGIEVGNGLPDIATIPHVLESLKKAGWEVIESFEMSTGAPHENKQTPWYHALEGSFSLTGFRMTKVGRQITHAFVTVLQAVGIAPKGSVKVSKLLNDTANDLVEGGQLDIFTPSFFFLARKPE